MAIPTTQLANAGNPHPSAPDSSTTCAALSVVLNVQELHTVRELKARQEELKDLHPNLFLTEADVGRAFCVTTHDDPFAFHETMIFSGRDDESRYVWSLPGGLDCPFIRMWEDRGRFVAHGEEAAWQKKYARPINVNTMMTATRDGQLVMPEWNMREIIFEEDEFYMDD